MTKEQRQARREAARLIKMYCKNLDNVYNACAEIAKAYKRDSIPLITLKEAIKTVKVKIKQGADEQRKA